MNSIEESLSLKAKEPVALTPSVSKLNSTLLINRPTLVTRRMQQTANSG
jgi:hypothetical protein